MDTSADASEGIRPSGSEPSSRSAAELAREIRGLDPRVGATLVEEIRGRSRTRVALLGGARRHEVADSLRQLFDKVRVSHWEPTSGDSRLHVQLCSRTPYDIILELGDTTRSEQVRVFDHAFGHLVVGGKYIALSTTHGAADHGAGDPTVRSDGLRAHLDRARATAYDRAASPAVRDLASLGRQIRDVDDVGSTLVVTKTLRVRPKLRDDQTNAVLRLRPRLGEVLTSMPGGTFPSRCIYDDNAGPDGDTSAGFRDPYRYSAFSVPSVHFRRYDRPVCARGQIVVSQGVILPDTYRHHLFPRLVNMYVNDVAPLFGQVRQSVRSPRQLDGAYFHFDSEWPGHFGHTVTEQLSRLWALPEARRLEPELKLLMTVQQNRSPQRLTAWESELLSSFGFGEADVEIFDEPVRPERLYAATPMFSCPDYVHPGIAAVWSSIGSRLAAQSVRTDLPSRLFCSRRTTLKRACRNTEEVEQFFASHGFEIVFPEDHSLTDQVAMFSRAEVIAGFAGSALFNIAFCETPRTVLMITPESYTARNEYLFASVRGHRLHTVWTRPDTPHPQGRWSAEAFSSSFVFDFEREGEYVRRLLHDLDGNDAQSPRSSGQKRG